MFSDSVRLCRLVARPPHPRKNPGAAAVFLPATSSAFSGKPDGAIRPPVGTERARAHRPRGGRRDRRCDRARTRRRRFRILRRPGRGSRGTATAQSARSCVSRELVAPAAGMTVARPIPLRATRRVAVGLGQRFSEGSALLPDHFRAYSGNTSGPRTVHDRMLAQHAVVSSTRARRRAPAVEVGFFRRIKGRAQRHGPNRRWRFRYKGGNGEGASRPGDAKNACPVLGRAGQDGR